MVDFPKFTSTALELYGLWPALFNWAGGVAISTLAFVITAAWWMRGYKAERDIAIVQAQKAGVESEKAALKGQMDVQIAALSAKLDSEKIAAQGQIQIMEQRLTLAAEQNKAAEQELRRVKERLSDLKGKAEAGEALPDIRLATENLGFSFDKLLSANAKVSKTLSIPTYFGKQIEVMGDASDPRIVISPDHVSQG